MQRLPRCPHQNARTARRPNPSYLQAQLAKAPSTVDVDAVPLVLDRHEPDFRAAARYDAALLFAARLIFDASSSMQLISKMQVISTSGVDLEEEDSTTPLYL